MGKTCRHICALGSLLVFCDCAGPNTPLGAIDVIAPSQAKRVEPAPISRFAQQSPGGARLSFYPPRQVLHGPRPLEVVIDDPAGVASHQIPLQVRYNGLDVTPEFFNQARVSRRRNDRQVKVELPVVRLPASQDHVIEFYYRTGTGDISYSRYLPPVCRAFNGQALASTDTFSPPVELLQTITRVARATGVSPSFAAALIAQESSFKTDRVSRARAVGLTQMTPLAEDEISENHRSWPRYPGGADFSFLALKMMVSSGEMNARNEWRLNPELSIQGGLEFLLALAERWGDADHLPRIRALFDNPDEAYLRLVLASYNAGFARVQAALDQYGIEWLSAPELKGARGYVNRIMSYCDQFSGGEVL